MNQQLWSGLATAALMITSLGAIAPSSYAEQPIATDEASGADISDGEARPDQVVSSTTSATPSDSQPSEAVKVGEYQSDNDANASNESVAVIESHDVNGRQAATLYVRNIPVITILGNSQSTVSDIEANNNNSSTSPEPDEDIKVASSDAERSPDSNSDSAEALSQAQTSVEQASDPVWRATAIAAEINQLYRGDFNPESIVASWDTQRERYLIRVGDEELVEIGSDVILPDTTHDPANDVLQVANRLRRQLGDAPPLREVEGRPEEEQEQQVSFGPIQFTVRGIASWYGPGFNGRRSASGEVFNQNAMTAAHRNLPFGTRVRVTNLDNGQSVVVRINDRGPFSGRRVIDLSAGAARAVGMINAGTAPVSLDVLEAAGSSSN